MLMRIRLAEECEGILKKLWESEGACRFCWYHEMFQI